MRGGLRGVFMRVCLLSRSFALLIVRPASPARVEIIRFAHCQTRRWLGIGGLWFFLGKGSVVVFGFLGR